MNGFNVKVGEHEKEHFIKSLLANNVRRGKILAIIILLYEVVLAIIDVSAFVFKADRRFQFSNYLIMYLTMIVINVAYLTIIHWYKKQPNKTMTQMRIMDSSITVYITLMMSWGSIISLMDQRLYGQIIVFMVNMITCSVIYYLHNEKAMISYTIATLILLIGLPFFQSSHSVLIGHYVNIVFFVVVSWVASRIIFYSFYNDFKSKLLLHNSNQLLKKEIEQNSKINTKLAEANRHLMELTLVDELTGIPNRRSFNNYIEIVLENYAKKPLSLSIVMIDIDNFKGYNDYYGHSKGDEVLTKVANQINSIYRYEKDFFARLGGEEFIYIALDCKENEVEALAEKIRDSVSSLKIVHYLSKHGYVTISLGVCTMQISNSTDVEQCISLADKALYVAKANGRNCVAKI